MRLSTTHVLLLVTLLYYVILARAQEDGHSSICYTMQYRMLSIRQQNEHQCMILEQLHQDLAKEQQMLKTQYHDLYTMVNKFQTSMHRNIASLTTPSRDSSKSMPNLLDIPLVRDCSELQMHDITLSGVYPIRLPNRNIVNVWCDMETSHGGWTIIQRRLDGKVNFTRTWGDYSFGFGNVNSEYWLGNENLHWLSQNKNYSIQFDMWDWEGNYAYAMYDHFKVENEQKNFQLKIQGYSGTAGDAMFPYHNNMRFSTPDRDNDEWYSSCARNDQSGWWFKACGYASLNGVYIPNGTAEITPDGVVKGIVWSKWKKEVGYSLKRTEIKIKPRIQIQHHIEQNNNFKSDNSATQKSVTDGDESVTKQYSDKSDEVAAMTTTNAEIVPTTETTTTTTEDPDIYYDDYYDYYKP